MIIESTEGGVLIESGNTLEEVKKKYPNAVESVVAAWNISHVYYEKEWGVNQIATSYYTDPTGKQWTRDRILKFHHESSSNH